MPRQPKFPCTHGDNPPKARNGSCVYCVRERSQRQRDKRSAAEKEAFKAYQREWYEKNQEEVKAKSNAYYHAKKAGVLDPASMAPRSTYSPEEHAWKNMIHRCENPNNAWYHRYGGRGIEVCSRWRGPRGLDNFLKDMGPRPSDKHSLDREDNDGHYEPSNCRWASPKEQAENKVRSGRNGPTMNFEGKTLREWAESIGVGYDAFKIRYRKYRNGLISYDQLIEPPHAGKARGRANHKR